MYDKRAKQDALDLWFSMPGEMSVDDFAAELGYPSGSTLRNWIWLAVNTGQPIPGCITVEAIRCVLRERGEDGSGYHNT